MARRSRSDLHLIIVTFWRSGGRTSLYGQPPLSADSAIERGLRAFDEGRVHEAGEIFAAAAEKDSHERRRCASASHSSPTSKAAIPTLRPRCTTRYGSSRRTSPPASCWAVCSVAPETCKGAVHTYEALQADHPSQEIEATLARWRREDDLQSQMQQTVGAHFSVAFEGPAEQALADRALASLERAYDRIGDVLGSLPGQPHSRRPLHDAAVPRHHARAAVGRWRVRRYHPRADAGRTRAGQRARPRARARVHACVAVVDHDRGAAVVVQRRTCQCARERRHQSRARDHGRAVRTGTARHCSPAPSRASRRSRRRWPTRRAPWP